MGIESAEVVGQIDEYLTAPERSGNAQNPLFSTRQHSQVIWDAGEVNLRAVLVRQDPGTAVSSECAAEGSDQ